MAGNGVRFHVDLSFAAPGRGVARCPTEVGRLSSLFDQSIPSRLQIMMFSSPSPCNKAGTQHGGGGGGGGGGIGLHSRHSVARTRNDTEPPEPGSKLFRNAVNALFSAPWYFQIEFPFVGRAGRRYDNAITIRTQANAHGNPRPLVFSMRLALR